MAKRRLETLHMNPTKSHSKKKKFWSSFFVQPVICDDPQTSARHCREAISVHSINLQTKYKNFVETCNGKEKGKKKTKFSINVNFMVGNNTPIILMSYQS